LAQAVHNASLWRDAGLSGAAQKNKRCYLSSLARFLSKQQV